MKKTLLLFVLCLSLLCLFAACGQPVEGAVENADADHGAVVGSVNGVNLYEDEYEYYLGMLYMNEAFQYYDAYQQYYGVDLLDEASSSDVLIGIEQSAWNAMVSYELIRQLAQDDYGLSFPDSYLPGFLPWSNYRNVEVQYLYMQLSQAISEELAASATASEEEARAAYEADPAQWDGRLTSHILIKCDVNDEAALAEAKAEAEAIIVRLDAGEDFAELAKECSDDGSASQGGVISTCINVNGQEVGGTQSLYEVYTAAAFELENEGDYTVEPVLSSAGYHIIKLDEIRAGFDTVKDIVTASLVSVSSEDISAAFNEKLAAKQEEAEIVESVDFKYYAPAEEEAAADGEAAADDETAADDEAAAE